MECDAAGPGTTSRWPYRRGDAARAVMAGDVAAMFGGGSIGHIDQAGSSAGSPSGDATFTGATRAADPLRTSFPALFFVDARMAGPVAPAGTRRRCGKATTEVKASLAQPDGRTSSPATGSRP